MIAALIQGQITGEPKQRTTGTGKTFWTAPVRVAAGDGDALFVNLGTFSETAGARLMKLSKGSAVAAAGVLEQTIWQGDDGAERRGWRLTANEVMSVHSARSRRDGGGANADSE